MHIFTDKEGTEWKIEVNVGSIMQIDDTLGCSILDDPSSIPSKAKDMIAMLYILLEEQLEAKEVSPEDFPKLLDGKALVSAEEALADELTDFFTARDPVFAASTRKIRKMQAEQTKKVLKEVKNLSLEDFGKLLEQSEWTQEVTPSGN